MQVFQPRAKVLETSSPVLEPRRKRVTDLETTNRELREEIETLRATRDRVAPYGMEMSPSHPEFRTNGDTNIARALRCSNRRSLDLITAVTSSYPTTQ